MLILKTYLVIGVSTLVILLLDDWWSKRTQRETDIFLVKKRHETKDTDYWIELAARLIIGPIVVVMAWPYALLFFGLNWRRERRKKRLKRDLAKE